jgi:hypothetical protein
MDQVEAVEAHLATGRCGKDDPHDRAFSNLVDIIKNLRGHMTNSQNTLRMVLDELPDEQRFQIINAIGEKRRAMRENDQDDND